MKTILIRLPEDLHHAFKVQAAIRSENLNYVLVRCIQEYVKQGSTKLKKK